MKKSCKMSARFKARAKNSKSKVNPLTVLFRKPSPRESQAADIIVQNGVVVKNKNGCVGEPWRLLKARLKVTGTKWVQLQ